MAEASYPFDGGSGSIITEQQWSNMSATWQDNGVIASDPGTMALKVTTLNQVGIVYVEPGEANVLGFHYENTASLPVAVPPNNTSLTRIDLVVLQLDKNTNAVRVAYREGLAASSPVPPTLVTVGGVYEIALAQIQMNPNTTQVPSTAPQLVDKRMFIGKRIQPREDIDELPIGAIGYKPSNGKFYGINGGGASELGAPPDLSGYSLTTHTHASSGGGVTVCTSSTRPAAPTLGQQIWETNTARSLFWDGSAWVVASLAPLIMRRSQTPTQTVSLTSTATPVNIGISGGDSSVSAGTIAWPSQGTSSITVMSLPVTTRWAIMGSISLIPAEDTGYILRLGQSTNILAESGNIGDDTSTVGTQATALSVSTTFTVILNTATSFTLTLSRFGGIATSASVNNASLSIHRIG